MRYKDEVVLEGEIWIDYIFGKECLFFTDDNGAGEQPKYPLLNYCKENKLDGKKYQLILKEVKKI